MFAIGRRGVNGSDGLSWWKSRQVVQLDKFVAGDPSSVYVEVCLAHPSTETSMWCPESSSIQGDQFMPFRSRGLTSLSFQGNYLLFGGNEFETSSFQR